MKTRLFLGYATGLLVSGVLVAFATFPALSSGWSEAVRANIPSPLEAWGAVTGAWGIWLTVKLNILNWPISIFSSGLYALFFYQGRLYANMNLQYFYVVLGLLGWYWWAKGGQNGAQIAISRLSPRTGWLLLGLIIPTTALCFVALTGAKGEQPFWDAFTFSISMVAQFMQSRKIYENWPVWIFVNLVYVGLFFYEKFYLSAILFALFALMAAIGMSEWKAKLPAE